MEYGRDRQLSALIDATLLVQSIKEWVEMGAPAVVGDAAMVGE